MERLGMLPGAVILGLLAGCNWITDADVAARAGQVDDDGDGVAAENDCDDNNSTISPATPEIWYDGVDQDCQGGDDYDQDADGYVPDDFVGLTTKGVKTSGQLPGGDCDDAEPLVSPKQPDTFYDGTDQDCSGNDDYDQDGDGYVPDEYLGLATLYVPTSGLLPGDDCDDDNNAVHPGVEDVAYNGYDSDCGGEDDYDADGDGFVPDEYLGLETVYVEPSGNLPGGDCDDADASFNPGVAETYYTGFDEACDGFDDYDADRDGYVPDAYEGLATEGVEGTGGLSAGDCDDTDAAVRPRAVETPADLVDQDCDGGDSSVMAIEIEGYTWINPRSPVAVEARDRVYISVATEKVTTADEDIWFDAGFAVVWDVGYAVNDAGLITTLPWSKSSYDPSNYSVGAGHDFIVADNTLYGALGFSYTSSRAVRIVSYPLTTGTAGDCTAQSTSDYDAPDDVSVALDSTGRVFAVACDGGANGALTYVRVDELTASANADVNQTMSGGDASATACALDMDTGPSVLANVDGVYRYAFDPDSAAPTFSGDVEYTYDASDLDSWADDTGTSTVIADAVLRRVIIVEGDGNEVQLGTALDSPTIASASRTSDGSYLVAWVNSDATVRVAWGSEIDGWTYQDVTISAGTPTGVAAWSNGDEGLVAVTTASSLLVGAYAF